MLFPTPTADIVTIENISNLIMPSNWYSEPPFLLSIESQKAFSTGYNVNLLASGLNDFSGGSGGSGIYSGEAGTLISLMKRITSYRLLVAKVPKIPGEVTEEYPGPLKVNPAVHNGWKALRDMSLDKFITEPLKDGYQEISLQYQDVTCNIKANLTLGSASQSYRYRAGVFSGVREFNFGNTIGARACAVFTCTGDNIVTCGLRFPKYNKNKLGLFSELSVTGTVPKRLFDPINQIFDSTFFQTSVLSSLSSLQPNEVDYKEVTEGVETTSTLTLANTDAELHIFGFWGRKFSDDGKQPDSRLIENYIDLLQSEVNEHVNAVSSQSPSTCKKN